MDLVDTENSPDDFHIKGAAARAAPCNSRSKALDDTCTICLDVIGERGICSPCNHLTFDFLCLASWLNEHNTCPLCKAIVREVQYDWRGPHDYKTFSVSKPNCIHSTRHGPPSRRRRWPTQPLPPDSDALEARRCVYRNKLYSLRVGANRVSQYRDFNVEQFSTSTELQSRTRQFLRRELQVFTFLGGSPRAVSKDFLTEYMVAILKSNELRGADGTVENLVAEVLGRDNTRLLLHELEAWLRSPYARLGDWDRHVQYADRPAIAKQIRAESVK